MTPRKYDVFISFRGEDTRDNFTSHLLHALSQKQVKTFIDYELPKGDEISSSLLDAIQDSHVSVVVFSDNYASSKWCLDELVKILQCRKDQRQDVIPVFYNIDPSHVRKQTGSFDEAFQKHMQDFRQDMHRVHKWKNALTEAASLAGWDSHSRSYRDDSELIQNIVKDVLQKLNYHYPLDDMEGLVGIYRNCALVEMLLEQVQRIGIWGMGGIGKTTIVKAIFEKHFDQYEGCCFLANVRERSGTREGLRDLRNRLHSQLLGEDIRQISTATSTFVKRRLLGKKIFIVLDDVSSLEQLRCLLGELQCCNSGSRIIITARDKSVLQSARVDKIHEVEELDFEESLQLFSLNAFNECHPQMGYEELSQMAVVYCKGVPLALIILGCFLHSKSESEWDSALKKLDKIPHEEIQNVLRLSFDGLNDKEKEIFLDIACFFKGEQKEHIISLLDNCGFHAVIGMRSLHDKALINIDGDFVCMHDLIQEMGREIVRQESIKSPGKRSRLWDFDEICDVLKNNKETNATEGIMLDMSQCRQQLYLSADTFKKMPNLRVLKIYIPSYKPGRLSSLHFSAGLESFGDKLRYLEWHNYPLQCLPSNFCPEKLVYLRMPNNQFKKLWDGVQNLVNLKEVTLSKSKQLLELPDFSKAQNLEAVYLFSCSSLRSVHSSILSLGSLKDLALGDCQQLVTLESEAHLRSLTRLDVGGCSSLERFSLSYLGSLEHLSLPSCGPVIDTGKLYVIFYGLQSLQTLWLLHCPNLSIIPHNISLLSSLHELLLDGSGVVTLPASIKHLSRLKRLSLYNCTCLQSLPELPSSILVLYAANCSSLKTVEFNLTTCGSQAEYGYISFHNCMNLVRKEFLFSFHRYIRDQAHGYELRRRKKAQEHERYYFSNPFSYCYPGCKVPEWFTYRTKGASITVELASPSNHHFGSLLCVVLFPCGFLPYSIPDIRCQCYLEDGKMRRYQTGSHLLNSPVMEGNLGHVYIYHFDVLSKIVADRVNDQCTSSTCNPKVTFKFSVCDSLSLDQNECVIKECGIYPLYPSDRLNLIKQMELELGMKTKKHKEILELRTQ